MSLVSIVKTNGNAESDITLAVRKAVELSGGLSDIVKKGSLVLVKPNLVAVPKERLSGAVTRWEVCRAVADLVKEAGGQPVIAESAAAGVNTEKVIEACGYDKLRDMGYDVVDLKRDKKVKIKVNSGEIIDEMDSFELVEKADVIISVPVMKTHDQTEVTLGIKNLKGLINDIQKKEFHRIGVVEGVVDIITTLKPQFTVVDGTFGQEGIGPVFGDTVEMGLILASKDIVACDAVTGKVMGYEPDEVKITKLAAKLGLGEMDLDRIEVKGCSIGEVARRFKRSSEVEIPGLPPFELIFTEGACTGCKNTVMSVIMEMKTKKIEHLLEGRIIVAGPIDKLPEGANKENLVLVGKCTGDYKDSGAFVQGCPPLNIFVLKAIVADREKIEWKYATEEGTEL